MLYFTAFFLGLLYISIGQQLPPNYVKTVNIKLLKNGETVTDDFEVKVGETVTIKCEYDDYKFAGQVAAIRFQSSSNPQVQDAFLQGHVSDRWNADKRRYNGTFKWFPQPYYGQLTITDIKLEDAGEYRCEVTDVSNTVPNVTPAKKEVYVFANVNEVELVNVKDGKFAANEDENSAIICRAYNGSMPVMKITIGDDEPLIAEVVQTKDNETTEYEGKVYKIFTADHEGKKIKCVAEVPGFGSDELKSDEATLMIQAKPTISCSSNKKAKINDKISIKCTVSGNPAVQQDSIEWRTSPLGQSLKANQDRINLGLVSTAKIVNEKYEVELKVTIINDQYFGEYTLLAENSAGKGSAVVKVSKDADNVKDSGGGASSTSIFASLVLLCLGCLLL